MYSTLHYDLALYGSIAALIGMYVIGLMIYWFFNKKAHARDLAEIRKKLEELKPTDPEYNQARALYASMEIAAEHRELLHSAAYDGGGHDLAHSSHDDGGGHH